MFNNPSEPDSDFDEGTVTEVDPHRSFCKVKTLRGQNLNQVRWTQTSGGSSRAGDRVTPVMGDRVYIHHKMGYPLIYGFGGKLQTNDSAFPLSIDTGIQIVDTGNFSPEGINTADDQNKPGDILVGDRIIASTGGGILAVLRGGSLLLRSSRLAEIFISKWDDVVRIVSRNWEHLTDVSSDVVKNIKGRVYRYTGYARTAEAGKIEDYEYNLYYGDVELAKAVKTNYWSSSASPAASSIIAMEEVPGKQSRTVDAANGTVIQKVGQTTITQTAAVVTIDFNNGKVITVNGDAITMTHDGGGEVKIDSSGIYNTYNGHFCNVTSGGVQLG